MGPEDALLKGRVAVVTGAAVGIGEATAAALARFGADVAVCDRDADNLASTAAAIELQGRRALQGVLDVRDRDAVERFVSAVHDAFGRVDVLVNNAGGGFHAPFLDVTPNRQDALVRENFDSVTNLVRAAVPLMPHGGSILNVTSIEAHRAAPGYAIYAAQKAAVESLTRTLALELAGERIRVNCVAPDMIPTPGVGDLGDAAPTPLPVRGDPDHAAAAIVFLAGDMSSFVTGTTIHVDGGNLAAGGWRRTPTGFTL